MEINESAKSLGSTVRKNIEKAVTIIEILKIIEMAKEKDKKKVFNIMMMINKNDNPRMLFNHCLNSLPEAIIGIRLNNIINRGMISVKGKTETVIIMENSNLARGSKLCKNVFFFMNLKAFRNSKLDII
jgi:hypothetical protein